MPRTMIRGDLQVQNAVVYDDTAAAGITLQTNAQSLDSDTNAIRAQLRRILDASGGGNWYDPVYLGSAGQRLGLKQLADATYAQSQQPFAPPVFNYATIPIPANQNYVILSVAQGQAPSGNLAVLPTSFGAVVAQSASNGVAFQANELTALAGADALHPKNLIRVHNDANGAPVEDSTTNDVFGLLQAESTAADGAPANDTVGGARVKISFVKINNATKQLIAAAPADVAGISINYAYRRRIPLSQVPEGALGGDGAFIDNIGAADVTLTRATANQGGAGIPVTASVLWQVPNGQAFKVQSANGGTDILAIVPTTSGTNVGVTSNTFQVTTVSPSSFSQGVQAATATQAINLGTTSGQIDSPGLALTATGANALKLQAGAQVSFKDGFLPGSNWTATSVPLASGSAEWTSYKASFGEVSIAQAIITAARSANHRFVAADVTPLLVPAGTNITGAGSGANINAQLPDYSSIADPSSNCRVLYNGLVLRFGSNQAAGQDWFPGSNRATGDIMLNFAVRGTASGKGDQIGLEVFGSS